MVLVFIFFALLFLAHFIYQYIYCIFVDCFYSSYHVVFHQLSPALVCSKSLVASYMWRWSNFLFCLLPFSLRLYSIIKHPLGCLLSFIVVLIHVLFVFFPLDTAIVYLYVDYSTLTCNCTLPFCRPFDKALFSHRNIIVCLLHCAACIYRFYTNKIVILNYYFYSGRLKSPQSTAHSP